LLELQTNFNTKAEPYKNDEIYVEAKKEAYFLYNSKTYKAWVGLGSGHTYSYYGILSNIFTE
jgi:hypothetical protein